MTPAEQAEAAVTLASWAGLLAHILDQAVPGSALDDDLGRFVEACTALRDAAQTPEPEPGPEPEPEPTEWPDAASTGPTGDLTPSGPVTSTHDGQVIAGLHITGGVTIDHDDVVVRDCQIDSTGRYGVDIDPATTGTLLARVRMKGVSGERSAGIPPYGSWTAIGCDIAGFVDGAKMGDKCRLERSWIHDLHKAEGTHNDGIQIRRGDDIAIVGCAIEGPWQQSTSAILAQAADGAISRLLIADTLISGGGYSLYLTEKGYSLDAAVRRVVWRDGSWQYGPISTKGSPEIIWDSCATDSGTALP